MSELLSFVCLGGDKVDILSDSYTTDTTTDATEAETLVTSEYSSSESYNNAMLVLSVLQLFVLIVIALFTIVRRSNSD